MVTMERRVKMVRKSTRTLRFLLELSSSVSSASGSSSSSSLILSRSEPKSSPESSSCLFEKLMSYGCVCKCECDVFEGDNLPSLLSSLVGARFLAAGFWAPSFCVYVE